MNAKGTLGLGSAVSTGVGLIIATSCLIMLGQGTGVVGVSFILPMALAVGLNMITAASICELNGLMPNLTGGLAQYTLAGMGPFPSLVSMIGGYLFCNSLTASAEGVVFGTAVHAVTGINSTVCSLVITVILIIVCLNGVDMFAKVQNIVAIGLIGSMGLMGIIGALGLGTSAKVAQPLFVLTNLKDILPFTAMAFWLFIGVEFVIPIAKDMKNPRKHVPQSLFLSLGIIFILQSLLALGFHNYVPWVDLAASTTPHLLYGINTLGTLGLIWMAIVAVCASISTLNTVINSLSQICYGMAKLNMLPAFFLKTNKKNACVWGVLTFGGAIFFIQLFIGIASANNPTAGDISFLVLTGSVFWMISYLLTHVNVLKLRRQLPKAPRSFRAPTVLIFVGIAGSVYMIFNVSTNPSTYIVAGVAFVVLGVYSFLWIKYRMKIPVFKAVPVEKVMATENELYYITHVLRPRERLAREKQLENHPGSQPKKQEKEQKQDET